jgi:sulfur-oxidizing protein SoxX
VPLLIEGDAIPQALTAVPGDAARGRAIVANRQQGLCLLCHTGPIPEERFQGDLAPSLAGAGSRWSEGQLRLRMADAQRLNPASIMPAYYRSEGLARGGRLARQAGPGRAADRRRGRLSARPALNAP